MESMALEAELKELKLGGLSSRAVAMGIDPDDVADAQDHGGREGLQHPIGATNLGACPPVPEVPEARDQPFGAASYVCLVWKTAIWGVHYINIRRRRYWYPA